MQSDGVETTQLVPQDVVFGGDPTFLEVPCAATLDGLELTTTSSTLRLVTASDTCATIFSAKNFKISNDRTVLHGVPFFLIFLIVVHAVGKPFRDQTISTAAVISTFVCC